MNALHRRCRARAVSHTSIFHRGTDNLRRHGSPGRSGRQDCLATIWFARKDSPHKDIL
jgi:hypothetical protein